MEHAAGQILRSTTQRYNYSNPWSHTASPAYRGAPPEVQGGCRSNGRAHPLRESPVHAHEPSPGAPAITDQLEDVELTVAERAERRAVSRTATGRWSRRADTTSDEDAAGATVRIARTIASVASCFMTWPRRRLAEHSGSSCSSCIHRTISARCRCRACARRSPTGRRTGSARPRSAGSSCP